MRRFVFASICVLLPQLAHAAAPTTVTLQCDSNCPSPADVAEELGPLLPHTRVVPTTDGSANEASALLVDEGAEFRIRVAGQERTFRDSGRSCRERARTAAVFIGLVLDPPFLPDVAARPETPAAVTPPPTTSPTPRATPVHPVNTLPLTLELAPLVQVAPISDAATLPVAGGFGGRAIWGRSLGVGVGAAFLLPTRLALPAADARLVWLPFDISLRATHAAGSARLSAELGPEAALLFASGDRVENPRTSTRVELGVRGAASLSFWMSRHFGAFFSFFGVVRPEPYAFKLKPDVPSGTTPPLWLGVALGLSFLE